MRMGGMVAAIERAIRSAKLPRLSYRYQLAVDRKEKIVVGVNDIRRGEGSRSKSLQIDESVGAQQQERLAAAARGALRRRGAPAAWTLCSAPPTGSDNLMPFLYEAVKAYATLGEICDALRDVFGDYEETRDLSCT